MTWEIEIPSLTVGLSVWILWTLRMLEKLIFFSFVLDQKHGTLVIFIASKSYWKIHKFGFFGTEDYPLDIQGGKLNYRNSGISQTSLYQPWLVWLSGLSTGLWTKGAHAWVAGQAPSEEACNRQPHIDVSFLLSLSLPLSLKISK